MKIALLASDLFFCPAGSVRPKQSIAQEIAKPKQCIMLTGSMAVSKIVSPQKFEEKVIARRREASLTRMCITYMTAGGLGSGRTDETCPIPYPEIHASGSPRPFLGTGEAKRTALRPDPDT